MKNSRSYFVNSLLNFFHYLKASLPWPWEVIQDDQKNRFVFLDSYRGILALVVIVAHSQVDQNCEFITFIIKLASTFAVDGFFALSSFLLTYRLMSDLKKSQNLKHDAIVILKYFIRRFFRIYVVFFIYVTAVKFGPKIIGGHFNYLPGRYFTSWYNLVTLGHAGGNHLWTIAPEVKYYFFIPILCFFAHKSGRYYVHFVLMCMVWAYLNEIYNFFEIKSLNLIDHTSPNTGSVLKFRFAVFFYGSISGMVLNLIESWTRLMQILKQNKLIQVLISISSIFLFYHGLKNTTPYLNKHMLNSFRIEQYPSLVWSTLFLLMTLGHPNLFTKQFSENTLLRSCGKYSFGLYLLHPIAVQLVISSKYFTILSKFENIMIMFCIAYFQAYLFFQFVEEPLMSFANKLCKRLDLFYQAQIQHQAKQVHSSV